MAYNQEEREEFRRMRQELLSERKPGVVYWGDSKDHIYYLQTSNYPKRIDHDMPTHPVPKRQ